MEFEQRALDLSASSINAIELICRQFDTKKTNNLSENFEYHDSTVLSPSAGMKTPVRAIPKSVPSTLNDYQHMTEDVFNEKTVNFTAWAKDKVAEDNLIKRSNFIGLKIDNKEEIEVTTDKTLPLQRATFSPRFYKWIGANIYSEMSEAAILELDKILIEHHTLKVNVVTQLNSEFPVSYDYNKNKSKIRTNYADPQIADDRTRNNIASRRSRQRKKFQFQIVSYSADYDEDENKMLANELSWLMSMIGSMEESCSTKLGANFLPKVQKLRLDCSLV